MRPLEDIRVLAVEQYGAGPFGSLFLADLGADVIKVEDPASRGDVSRYIPPFQHGEDSLFFETFNRNKRSISLDLRSAPGRGVFERLVSVSDAVYSNLRGDVPTKLGLTYDALSHANPRIVCVSLSGFGATGPESSSPGYDYIFQALTGWMSLTGDPDGPPTKTGLSLVDFSGGMVGALSLLAAVHAARRDGRGMDCDLNLRDVATSLLTYDATWALNEDWTPTRTARSAHPSLVPFQAFQGGDQSWFVVACAKEKFWRLLVDSLGDPRLNHERFADFSARADNKVELVSILDEIFATEATAHWVEVLEEVGVPVGHVRSVPEALADLEDRGSDMLIEVEHEGFGSIRELRTPMRVGDEIAPARRAPKRNEHGAEILAEIGYSTPEIEELAMEGAFG